MVSVIKGNICQRFEQDTLASEPGRRDGWKSEALAREDWLKAVHRFSNYPLRLSATFDA